MPPRPPTSAARVQAGFRRLDTTLFEPGSRMLFQPHHSRNARTKPGISVLKNVFPNGSAAVSVLAAALLFLPGCATPERSLQVWRDSARFEHVSRFNVDQEAPGRQWFARLVAPGKLPTGCVFQLSDRFDFVVISRPEQWAQFLRAASLTDRPTTPDFNDGVVVGLIAHVGQMRDDRWPILVSTVRQRGRIAFVNGEFHEGFYRPLAVPPYAHLVHVRGVDRFLGVKLNQLLYGFNVDIADLHAAGIK